MRVSLGSAPPNTRQWLTDCGVDPDAINPTTGVPNWVYPGNLPPAQLAQCQQSAGLPVLLPYGEAGPTVIINPDGQVGRPEETTAQQVIAAATDTAGVYTMTTAPETPMSSGTANRTSSWIPWAIAGVALVLMLSRRRR